MVMEKTTNYSALNRAVNWLRKKTNYSYYPIVGTPRGYAEYIAYIYQVRRESRPSVWYLVTIEEGKTISIKRICLY